MAYFKAYHSLTEPEEMSVRAAGNPAKIQARYIPNRRVKALL